MDPFQEVAAGTQPALSVESGVCRPAGLLGRELPGLHAPAPWVWRTPSASVHTAVAMKTHDSGLLPASQGSKVAFHMKDKVSV